MKIKTSELIDEALDWAVAKSIGGYIGVTNGDVCFNTGDGEGFNVFTPSTNWSQGGPIIGRMQLNRLTTNVGGGYTASVKVTLIDTDGDADMVWKHGSGPTPLIAAMRCYVASKLGDEIEIPQELTCWL